MDASSLSDKAEIRVYVDCVADMFHYGHARFFKQVRDKAQETYPNSSIVLVVGITNDDCLASYKRLPVFSNAERVEMVSSCKWVDEVLAEVPLVTSWAFCQQHSIDLVAHGDDFGPDKVATYYAELVERGRYFTVPYTPSVSTTNIIQRVFDRYGGDK